LEATIENVYLIPTFFLSSGMLTPWLTVLFEHLTVTGRPATAGLDEKEQLVASAMCADRATGPPVSGRLLGLAENDDTMGCETVAEPADSALATTNIERAKRTTPTNTIDFLMVPRMVAPLPFRRRSAD